MQHRRLWLLAALLSLAPTGLGLAQAPAGHKNHVIELLKQNRTLFGSFVRETTIESGQKMAADPQLDFVFLDMERGVDVNVVKTFMKGYWGGATQKGLFVRVPPVGKEPQKATAAIKDLLDAGVDGVTVPHIENVEQARLMVEAFRKHPRKLWPEDPNGQFVSFLMLEDVEAINNARSIMGVKGVSIWSPGPGSLAQAYNRDMTKVEAAVETVLKGCLDLKIPCANTATDKDVASKVQRGFRLLITQGEALAIGRKAAGR